MNDSQSELARYTHLFIYDDPSPDGGGIQNMAYWIPRNFAAHGLRVVLAGQADALNRPCFDKTGIERFPLKYPFRTSSTADLRLAILLLRLQRHYRSPTILYSMVINNIKIARWLAPLLRWKLVAFLHGNEILRLSTRRPKTLRRSLEACDVAFASSHYTQSISERIGHFNNIHVVHPGIPTAAFDGAQGAAYREFRGWHGKKIILMLSRLVRRKGYLTALQALKRVVSDHPEAYLVIAGTGPFEGEIRNAIRRHGLERHVELIGFVPEEQKPSLLASCDLFCMPSEIEESRFDVEGFGIVFIEAAVMGKPAIGTASGGIGEAILDRQTGFLVQPGDANELAARIDQIFSDPEGMQSMCLATRKRALEQFDWSAVSGTMLRILSQSIVD